MKESVVEIKGHKYRYVYENGETVYRGPVGDAPPISMDEFQAFFYRGEAGDVYDMPFAENQSMVSQIRDAAPKEGCTNVPADVADILMRREEEKGWRNTDGARAMSWFIFLHHYSHPEDIEAGTLKEMGPIRNSLDGVTVTLPAEMVEYINQEKTFDPLTLEKPVDAGKTFTYFADMLEA